MTKSPKTPLNSELLDRVQEFLDKVDSTGHAVYPKDVTDGRPVAELLWADVQLLVSVVRAGTTDENNPTLMREFLNSAERGIAGWKRANNNQIETIGRLQQTASDQARKIHELEVELEKRDRQVHDLEKRLSDVEDDLENKRYEAMGEDL